jgi:membrane-associated phospholipid phosphatase
MTFEGDSWETKHDILRNSNDYKLSNLNKKNNDITYKIFFISVFLIVSFFLEYTLRNYINKIGQFFLINNPDYCPLLYLTEFFEFDGRYILFFVILNFINVYAGLLIVALDCISIYLNGNIKLFYLSPRPYWEDTTLTPCFCANNYGLPSTTTVNQTILFMTVYKVFSLKYENMNKYLKYFIAFICFIAVFLVSAARLLQNVHTLDQLLIGISLAYALYYITFDIIGIDVYDVKQFNWIIHNPKRIIIFTILLFLLSYLLIFIIETGPEQTINNDLNRWLGVLLNYCKAFPLQYFSKESYAKITKLFLLLGCYIGILLENKFIMNNNFYNLQLYNINKENHKFNDTKADKAICRVIVAYLIYVFLIKTYFHTGLIVALTDENISLNLLMNYIIPFIIEGIIFFFIIKSYILVKLKLTNEDSLIPLEISKIYMNYNFEEMNKTVESSKNNNRNYYKKDNIEHTFNLNKKNNNYNDNTFNYLELDNNDLSESLTDSFKKQKYNNM